MKGLSRTRWAIRIIDGFLFACVVTANVVILMLLVLVVKR